MGLLDAPFGEDEFGRDVEERRIVPLLHGYIDEKVFNTNRSNRSGRSSLYFYSGDPVLILNPVDYEHEMS